MLYLPLAYAQTFVCVVSPLGNHPPYGVKESLSEILKGVTNWNEYVTRTIRAVCNEEKQEGNAAPCQDLFNHGWELPSGGKKWVAQKSRLQML
jgi:hypothetical protein